MVISPSEKTGVALIRLLDTHSKGAANELKAASYYLDNGFQAYFPVVQQGKVDFVIEKDNQLRRVQVKTASWNKANNHSYLQCRTRTTNKFQREPKDNDYDLLVIVFEEEIWEIPAPEINSSNLCFRTTFKAKKYVWDKFKVK